MFLFAYQQDFFDELIQKVDTEEVKPEEVIVSFQVKFIINSGVTHCDDINLDAVTLYSNLALLYTRMH